MAGIYGDSAEDRYFEQMLEKHLEPFVCEKCGQPDCDGDCDEETDE